MVAVQQAMKNAIKSPINPLQWIQETGATSLPIAICLTKPHLMHSLFALSVPTVNTSLQSCIWDMGHTHRPVDAEMSWA